MISLIIPVKDKNNEYTLNIEKNIRELYPNENEVEIIIYDNSNLPLSDKYNNAVAQAKGEKIILLHNDMILSKGFIETMDRDIVPGKIITYTRVEPPIYLDTYPGKVIIDCGTDLSNFNQDRFNEVSIEDEMVDGGSQIFFGCMKEDYIGFDGNTFEMFCEDDDIHLRYTLGGYERKINSAYVYHFVSKTSRAESSYQNIEINSNRNFVRKWGFRKSQHNKKYDIGYIANNCNLALLGVLEIWCNNIRVEVKDLITQYIDLEQPNTKFNLSDRIKTTELTNDIIVEFDATKLEQGSFQILQQLSDIIAESGEVGTFELDIFTITINRLDTYEHTLIKIS
jgi:GT2 family glycosyltransferase